MLDLKANITDKYVAFIDVMGFSNLVNQGSLERLTSYFLRTTDILNDLKVDKTEIQSFLISDSIILIAPDAEDSFVQLLNAVRRIQSALLWKKILIRGAVSYGEVYYNADWNIVVGKGFIKAYLLEKEAVYPRVIIDPSIVKKNGSDKADFLIKINGSSDYSFEDRVLYVHDQNANLPDDAIFIDYANRCIKKDCINGNLIKVYENITENLYGDQRLYSKYIWLKKYFLSCLELTMRESCLVDTSLDEYRNELSQWITKFERL